ncbi:MAG: type I-C CRISPR-associated protein Cas8c/Csd1 [Parabacteroides sp.]|nr:type I-C CRISPR-associated protein Cas8c/Csd1 [Parabacteroides sp.]
MILKALYDYYHRCGNLASTGYEKKEIPFVIVIDKEGNFVTVEDRRIDSKNSQKFLVIKDSRTSAPKPYLFYDNTEYVLNYTKDSEPLNESDSQDEMKASARKKKIEKSQEKHDLFVHKCQEVSLKYPESEEFKAVTLFYKNQGVEKVKNHPLWSEIIKKDGTNLSFMLKGNLHIVAEDDELLNEIEGEKVDSEASLPYCLITGEKAIPVETTSATMIPGSQAMAKLVAFQVNSGYDSYGKSKGLNAPISKEAEFSYTTALNKLLEKGSRNKFLIGNRTFLFWASSNSDASRQAEESLFNLLGYVDDVKDDPNRRIEQVRKVFNSIYSGSIHTNTDDKFYFLGLAPNAARIAVVYWNESSLKEFAGRILAHFKDMEIVDTRTDKKPYTGLFQIVSSVALRGKQSDIQPNIPEAIVKSIIQDIPYPYSLFSACIERIRAEQEIRITRAAIIKAYLNRINDNNQKIKFMIDKTNTNQGYVCGRLFATLEYLQERSSNGSNASIRSRYMNAASATPAAVFATIINLSIHHEEKLDKGSQIFFEQLKSEILDKISSKGFPSHLSLQDQGRFMVGYYHQRQEFYTKKDKIEVINVEQ